MTKRKTMMIDAFVCLGSNMGDCAGVLARACSALSKIDGVSIRKLSSVYLTEPQGRKDQPWFHNQVAWLACAETWTPEALLDELLRLEAKLGRVRDGAERCGPRAIDMDLLLFGSEIRNDPPHLILPHPRMTQRAFVLVPLLEIAPGIELPDGRLCSELLQTLHYHLEGQAIFQ